MIIIVWVAVLALCLGPLFSFLAVVLTQYGHWVVLIGLLAMMLGFRRTPTRQREERK